MIFQKYAQLVKNLIFPIASTTYYIVWLNKITLIQQIFKTTVCPTIYGLPYNSSISEVHLEAIRGGISGSGTTTTFWDCCQPACGWTGNIPVRVTGPVKSCAVDGVHNHLPNAQSACEHRTSQDAFACTDIHNWAVNDTFAFGFVAFSPYTRRMDTSKCCSCVRLDFQGKLIFFSPSARKCMKWLISLAPSIVEIFCLHHS